VLGTVTIEELLLHEATHCGKCHEERVTVAEVDGVQVCARCKWTADIAASRRIEDAREESGDE